MTKTKKSTTKRHPGRPPRQPLKTPPVARRGRLVALRHLCESAQWTPLVQNSYVLSRFWAWCSRIQISPKVSIPVPRFLSYRDP